MHSFARYLADRGHHLEIFSAEPPRSAREAETLSSFGRLHVAAAHKGRHRVVAAGLAGLRGQPGQVGWFMPDPAWRAATRVARSADIDVALAVTVRSLRGPLPVPLVTDFVNAISWDMRDRSRGPEGPHVRIAARFEAQRLAVWERRVAQWSSAGIAASAPVAAALPNPTQVHVIPVPWDEPIALSSDSRDIDVIFTGDMRYPPNREAALLLVTEIMPLVRKSRPRTTLWLVGRHAGDIEAEGVVTRADVPDMGAFLRRAVVAACPIAGRGSPYKVLEAAAAGTAIVASPWAVDCYGMQAEKAHTPDGFANGILRLLADDDLRAKRVADASAALQANSLRVLGPQLENILRRAAGLT